MQLSAGSDGSSRAPSSGCGASSPRGSRPTWLRPSGGRSAGGRGSARSRRRKGRPGRPSPGKVSPARQARPHLCACRAAGSAVLVREGVTGGSPQPSDVTARLRAQLQGAEPSGRGAGLGSGWEVGLRGPAAGRPPGGCRCVGTYSSLSFFKKWFFFFFFSFSRLLFAFI